MKERKDMRMILNNNKNIPQYIPIWYIIAITLDTFFFVAFVFEACFAFHEIGTLMDLYIIPIKHFNASLIVEVVDNLFDSTIYLISHLAFDLAYYRMICTIIWKIEVFFLLIQFKRHSKKNTLYQEKWTDISIKYCTNAINCLSLDFCFLLHF